MGMIAEKFALGAASLLLAASAMGATAIGNATADDVTLDGMDADAMAFQDGWNPHAGPNGDTSGFGTTFDSYGSGSWTMLDRYDLGQGFSNTGMLTFTFDLGTGTAGTWSVTNSSMTQDVTLDLVFAMHAGGGGASWLFDNQAVGAGQTLNGTWAIEWFTGANQANPAFSNLTLFGRDMEVVTTPVPEPGEYSMLLAGLGLVGLVARRRKQG